jgi:hypothetical protein
MWLPSHVWCGLWLASCSKRSAPAVRTTSFLNNSICYTYNFSIVPWVSSTIRDGTVRAAVESTISVRTSCHCISTSRNQGILSTVFGVARHMTSTTSPAKLILPIQVPRDLSSTLSCCNHLSNACTGREERLSKKMIPGPIGTYR